MKARRKHWNYITYWFIWQVFFCEFTYNLHFDKLHCSLLVFLYWSRQSRSFLDNFTIIASSPMHSNRFHGSITLCSYFNENNPLLLHKINEHICPLHGSNSSSVMVPNREPSHTLMTSLLFNSEKVMRLTPIPPQISFYKRYVGVHKIYRIKRVLIKKKRISFRLKRC